MKTRVSLLLIALLAVTTAGLGGRLDTWFLTWPGNRLETANPLTTAIGDAQRMLHGHFYRKADVYFHSGLYPTIFDNQESFRTAHMAEDAGVAEGHNTGCEDSFLGQPRDIIDRFSRHFFPVAHTHLDEGGSTGEHGDQEVREILPWLRLAAIMDPHEVESYMVASYWLRQRMGRPAEAEEFLRHGLRHNPGHPSLMFELGRMFEEDRQEPDRARTIWHAALRQWHLREEGKRDPDLFVFWQLHGHLARLEERAGNTETALEHWSALKKVATNPDAIQERIDSLLASSTGAGQH